MKKIKIILITVTAVLIVSSNSFAQRGQSGNCISQGAVAFDAFYGYPYINGALLKALSSAPVHNTNHLGAKVEYMVSDNVGLGVEFTYADASVMYSDSTGNHTAGIRKYRILGKMNYHFATTSNVDPYFTVGAGVKNTTVYDNGTKGVQIIIVSNSRLQ